MLKQGRFKHKLSVLLVPV